MSARDHTQRTADGALVRDLVISNKKGLHARASAKFVQTVERFDAQVKVTRAGETVGGNSIMGLMMLSAGPGSTITVECRGNEAAEVMDAICALIEGRFNEDD
ncbi:MAG TPA: HPr family phosphocarrier protein [Pseudorhodoplanes sp.]|jgi:phosphocarrier protein|nr:HPr family phosphocarrier protein [Pseudorhodoplanes sp.]